MRSKFNRTRRQQVPECRSWDNIGGQACKPDSVRGADLHPRSAAIIPLGPGSHQDSSSLPEGPDEPGSSPLLFGLAPRGVFRAVPIARDAVGSYPTFSPLPALSPLAGQPKVFPLAGH